MNLTRLPDPPDPQSYISASDPLAWQKAMYTWAQGAKAAIEGDSTTNTALLAFVANTGVQMPQGIVTAPSMSFANDPETGIYQPTIGEIAIAVEGVQELLLDSSGNLTTTTLNATTGDITTLNSTTGNITTLNTTTGNITTVVATTVDASTVTAPTGDLTLASTSGAVRAPTMVETDDSTAVATTAWVTGSPTVYDNIGRNKLHNSMFNIQQRGAGPWTANAAYTADRWVMALVGDTMSISIATATDTDRSQIGDESATTFIQNTFTGVNSAADFDALIQRIETVHRLSNQTVTVSFWAKCASGTLKLGVSMDQSFGTGGSPSSAVQSAGTAFTLSTTWARFSTQFTLGSCSGKTLGTNGNDYTALDFWFSSGTTNATRAGSIGVQSGIIGIWGVQVEIGSNATALEKPDIRYDLSNCMRFYQADGAAWGAAGYQVASDGLVVDQLYPVPMRATPSLVNYSFSTAINVMSPVITAVANTGMRMSATATATGAWEMIAAWNSTADL
jgi:hypothetical protein